MNTDGDPEPDSGGLGELLPEPLRPLWRRVAVIQAFRETHGDTYIGILEAITAAVLVGGYVYWAFLFLTQ